jgi:Tfp pilus assembly protein PilN
MQSINLIPQQEVQEQTKEKAVKVSTWFSILMLVVVGGIAGYYVFRTQSIKSQLNNVNDEITSLRQDITGMSEVEIYARNLDKKYNTLKEMFATRPMYSLLSKELEDRLPEGVKIEALTLQKGAKLNITGNADNYIAIAAFTNNLVNNDYDKGNSTLKALFKTVVLNSVSLEKARNVVSYSINVELDSNLLQKR